jgi:uncharacterized protein (TIGR02145 family)
MCIRDSSQSVPSYVPTNGLVGWWGFNGNAQDGSGNGNHGTVNGATLTTDRFGNQNSAYNFDGVDDWIQVDDHTTLRPNHITISAWIYVNTPTINPIVTKTRIGNPFGPDGGEQYCIFQSPYNYQNTAGSFQIKRNGGCQNGGVGWYRIFQTNLPFSTGQWQHIVGTYDGDTMKLYNNGLLSGFQVPPSGPIDNCSNGTFNIGRGWVNYDFYNGKMDNLGMWNRALTPQEITNLYNSQLPTQTSLCLPTITTTSPSSVGVDTVVIGGDISNDGGSSIVLRGICYSTSPNPNMGNQRTEDGSGIGSFNTILRGLISSTTYYARSYAKNSNGVVVYGNEVSFTTTASLPGVRCPGTPTVTDIDGNVYNTVQIGNQCWTQSNLKVTRYRNGDSIIAGLSNSLWQGMFSGAYSIYNNDSINDSLFGKLYNFYSVSDSRGLCPTGWHVSTDAEWNALEYYVGINPANALKSTLLQPNPGGWLSPNNGANNSSGFYGLPGGIRGGGNGSFSFSLSHGFWWSPSMSSSARSLGRVIRNVDQNVSRTSFTSTDGFSVRCLQNILPQVNTISISNIASSFAVVIGEVIIEGDQNVLRGFCYANTSNPTILNDTIISGNGYGHYTDTLQNLTPANTYYFRAYATNSVGTSYGAELGFSTPLPAPLPCPGIPIVTDIDGNVYNTVQIGAQCWTQANLKVTRYRNGDMIPTGLNNSEWSNTTLGAYAIYNNDAQFDGLYGKLYNHYAVADSRGLCPLGWKVPSYAEWNTLENQLGGRSVAGGAMKSTMLQPNLGGWNSPNIGATNSSGFTGLPGGLRTSAGNYGIMSSHGYWWDSTAFSGSSNAWTHGLYSSSNSGDLNGYVRTGGFSVRCLKE